LEQGQFRVTLAYDGREADGRALTRAGHRLVLLDLMMPHLSGLDVLAAMRADARWRDVPCIILTAAGEEQQHTRAMELGATAFLTKPFSPKKLYARAAELAGLDSRRSGRRHPPMKPWIVVARRGVGSRFWPLSTPTRPKTASSPRLA
jgi:DNA-binding response OmpR family regulator